MSMSISMAEHEALNPCIGYNDTVADVQRKVHEVVYGLALRLNEATYISLASGVERNIRRHYNMSAEDIFKECLPAFRRWYASHLPISVILMELLKVNKYLHLSTEEWKMGEETDIRVYVYVCTKAESDTDPIYAYAKKLYENFI